MTPASGSCRLHVTGSDEVNVCVRRMPIFASTGVIVGMPASLPPLEPSPPPSSPLPPGPPPTLKSPRSAVHATAPAARKTKETWATRIARPYQIGRSSEPPHVLEANEHSRIGGIRRQL